MESVPPMNRLLKWPLIGAGKNAGERNWPQKQNMQKYRFKIDKNVGLPENMVPLNPLVSHHFPDWPFSRFYPIFRQTLTWYSRRAAKNQPFWPGRCLETRESSRNGFIGRPDTLW